MDTDDSVVGTTEGRGDLIRFYRERRGWTQLQLATHSGFSERTIRTAENGEPVRNATLAKALSGPGLTLTAADLSACPMAIAQAFVRGYLQYKEEAATRCAHLFHPDVILVIHADPHGLAFGGEFRGVAGIDRMIRTAYEQFEPVNEDFGKWYTSGQRVAALRQQVLRARGATDGPEYSTWILHEYTVTAGRIQRIDNYLDAAIYLKLLEFRPSDIPTSLQPPKEA